MFLRAFPRASEGSLFSLGLRQVSILFFLRQRREKVTNYQPKTSGSNHRSPRFTRKSDTLGERALPPQRSRSIPSECSIPAWIFSDLPEARRPPEAHGPVAAATG